MHNQRIITIKQANEITGGLSKPGKMPGSGYGIPAKACNVGASLVKVKGSVCEHCYALKGRYNFPNVQSAQTKRLGSLGHNDWVAAMVVLIQKSTDKHFRWHDAGDLQGPEHLEKIIQIAELCPDVSFWLPTREVGLLRKFLRTGAKIPNNLVIRVSGAMIDGPAPAGFTNTSRVANSEKFVTEDSNVKCPASQQGNSCGECRRCWDSTVSEVVYLQH